MTLNKSNLASVTVFISSYDVKIGQTSSGHKMLFLDVGFYSI